MPTSRAETPVRHASITTPIIPSNFSRSQNVASGSDNLKIWSLNIQGKLEEFGNLFNKKIKTQCPDIICLQETWTKGDKTPSSSLTG